MTTFTRNQLVAFLDAVDRVLMRPQRIVILGLSAASLQFGYDDLTTFIEIQEEIKVLVPAIQMAQTNSGVDVSVQKTTSCLSIRGLDSRLSEFQPELRTHLQVFVPETVDLIILALGDIGLNELVMIDRLVKFGRISADEITRRFESEVDVAVKIRPEIEANLHMILEYCFSNSIPSQTEH